MYPSICPPSKQIVFPLYLFKIMVDVNINPYSLDLWFFTFVEKRYGPVTRGPADHRRSVSLDDHRVYVRAVPVPLDSVGRDSDEIPFLTMEPLIFDKEPVLPFK